MKAIVQHFANHSAIFGGVRRSLLPVLCSLYDAYNDPQPDVIRVGVRITFSYAGGVPLIVDGQSGGAPPYLARTAVPAVNAYSRVQPALPGSSNLPAHYDIVFVPAPD